MTKIRLLQLIAVVFPAFVFAQAMKSTLALQGGSAQINGYMYLTQLVM